MNQAAIRTLEVGASGLQFEVDVAGVPGRPLVLLLHGFPQTSYAYRDALPALAQAGYFAVAPNQRGYSPRARPLPIAEYATQLLVDDALAIAGALGAERFHLVGHDWGGQLAWLMAVAHAERLYSLSVLSRPHPAAFARALKSDPAQADRSRHHRAFGDPNTAARLLEDDARRFRASLRGQGVADADVDAYLQRLADPAALDAALNWYRAAQISATDRRPVRVPDVEVPTLYMWGDADATVGRQAAEDTAQYVSAAYRFEVIAGAGHFLTDQVADQVTRLLVQHIDQFTR